MAYDADAPVELPYPAGAIEYRDERGYVMWFMVTTFTSEHRYSGTCYEVSGWEINGHAPLIWEEVATIVLKWDGCAHIGFRSPELDKEWVHVCGAKNMELSLAMLRWMWTTAQGLIPAYDPAELVAASPK